ncbi:hypothetical protein [Marilutibacter spongiae]|uniref:Uncharacterized protein n=1 Tax=Marilutibacter spongiae TaxID=2025720 RepID=A0A7W3TPK8_9GAMM|nr:hypothetical protein [Lysobacter spongiae]MBB1062168.1 hypothetical protein [Lysobacter spongiae]
MIGRRHLAWIALVAAAVAGGLWLGAARGWQSPSDPTDQLGLEFRFLGCDDWPEDRPYGTTLQRSGLQPGLMLRVSHPASCGYSVRAPRYKLSDDTLRLSYDLHAPSGEFAACVCEYKSEFRFRSDPGARRVVFDHSES